MSAHHPVLVVEDEMMVAMLIEDMLLDLGFEMVGPVADAASAVKLAANAAIGFALLDVNLNGETSFPAADMLMARGINFAFLTGYGEAGVRPDLRVWPVLGKPIDPISLKRVVMRGLAEH